MDDALTAPDAGPPEAFIELVRDALLHLYDPVYLQTHPLLACIGAEAGQSTMTRGKRLRQALLDAIEALQPGAAEAAAPYASRAYRILELRYIEGHEVAEILSQVALSKSQYHREHHRALQAVASLLWERWRRPGVPPHPADRRRTDPDMTRQEVEQLVAAAPPRAARVDPLESLRSVASLLRPLCTRRAVTLDLTLPDRAPAVRGERVALRQLLLMVLAYAIETADGRTVAVSLHTDQARVRVRVRSPGLAQETVIPTADWLPFLEALHGRLDGPIPAPDGPGGLLDLSFPAADVRTVLVVDNNTDFISLIQRYLAGTGWEAVGVSSVDQALAFARQQCPAAIVLDIVIPGRDGWDLLVDLKTTPATQDIPVIVCSVLAEPEVAATLGAAAYLRKPISQDQLLAALSGLPLPAATAV